MICPLKIISHHQHCNCNCEKEECAWYNKNCGKCAVATLAENSESVSEAAAGQRTIFVREC